MLLHEALLEQPAYAESLNGGNTEYRDGGVYCKRFHVPVEWRETSIFLRLEGSYCNTFVYLNGQLAADHPNGYTGFTVSLNGFLPYGHENLWTRAKTSLDYSAHFTGRALSDLAELVHVARSVILYSIGNKIPECAISAGMRLGENWRR